MRRASISSHKKLIFSHWVWPRPALAVGSIQLPFDADPIARTYLFSAYPLGIVGAHRPIHAGILGLYVQLFMARAKLVADEACHRFEFFPRILPRHFAALGHFQRTDWPTERFLAGSERQLVTGLVEALRRRSYLYLAVNEFFIPGTASYRVADFRHTFLVSGYDAQARSFTACTYLKGGVFAPIQVPERLLAAAIRSLEHGLDKASAPKPTVMEFQMTEMGGPDWDTDRLSGALRAYLNWDGDPRGYLIRFFGQELADDLLPGKAEELFPGTIGAEAGSLFGAYLHDRVRERKQIDLRATRNFFEHKQVLHRLLAILSGRCGLGEAPFCGQFGQVVGLAKKLHVRCFAYNDQPGSFEAGRIRSEVDQVIALERKLLGEALTTCR